MDNHKPNEEMGTKRSRHDKYQEKDTKKRRTSTSSSASSNNSSIDDSEGHFDGVKGETISERCKLFKAP